MASGTGTTNQGGEGRRNGLSRLHGSVVGWLAGAGRASKAHDLVTHRHDEELLEESGGEPAVLTNREAALLGYIESRKS
jgi:hypothetical protein